MTEKPRHKQAAALADGARELLDRFSQFREGALTSWDLLPARELLTMAIILLEAKDEAREAKNAGERERRPKPKPKPKARPRKPTPGAFAAPAAAGARD